MHTHARTGSIDRIYLHTNEGPQHGGPAPTGTNDAENLAHYLLNNGADGGGYQVIVDADSTVRLVDDNTVTWGAGGDNEHSLHVCFIGYSATIDWFSPYGKSMFDRAVKQVAEWCVAHGIPAVHLSPGCPPDGRGIVEHADDTCASSDGHTDPGVKFPLQVFVNAVNTTLNPPPDPALVAFFKMVASFVKPIRFGDTGKRVAFVQDQLHRRAPQLPTGQRGHYDMNLVRRVKTFKTAQHFKNTNGTYCGLPCVKALFKS